MLGDFMDGEGRGCDELGAEQCDYCAAAGMAEEGSDEAAMTAV